MRPAIRYIIHALVTIWLVVTVVFFALRLLPGDAINTRLRQIGIDDTIIQAQREQFGLNEPILVQYLLFWRNLAFGDLGISLTNGLPVVELISQRFRTTAILACGASVLAVVMGFSLGIVSARHLRYGLSTVANAIINFTFSIPIFLSGTLLLFVFRIPIVGDADTFAGYIAPVGLLGIHTSGAIARIVKTHVEDTSNADFVRVARGKGLTERYIYVRHILRVGLLPVITVSALQMGYLLSGVVITEMIFMRPGMGTLLLDSVLRQDYPVVQGIVLLSACVYIGLNLIADLLHRLVDPRLSIA